jgi:hypothetical protein
MSLVPRENERESRLGYVPHESQFTEANPMKSRSVRVAVLM